MSRESRIYTPWRYYKLLLIADRRHFCVLEAKPSVRLEENRRGAPSLWTGGVGGGRKGVPKTETKYPEDALSKIVLFSRRTLSKRTPTLIGNSNN